MNRLLHGRVERVVLPLAAYLLSSVSLLSTYLVSAGEPASPSSIERKHDLSFRQDVEFLSNHVKTIVLKDPRGQSQVAVVPDYQGRVMTSTANGENGISFGWLNYSHIESGEVVPHINVYGGEERFWLGPEGGQYAIFFKPGSSFTLDDWQTPAAIDTDAYELVSHNDQQALFRHRTKLTNYSNAEFDVQIDRTVKLLSHETVAESLEVKTDKLQCVGYRTENRITNVGENDWQRETGLLSIWLLGMYKPSPETTVVIPLLPGSNTEGGHAVNDAYFGKVPQDRLRIHENTVYFSGDGKYRSKIGIPPLRSTNICGSYDAQRGVVTIVKFSMPAEETSNYVNSMWELQEEPYAGDVINSYNDGPPSPGAKPLGPFYELETSSPALALSAGETAEHVQETYHFMGEKVHLNQLTTSLFGLSLEQISQALD